MVVPADSGADLQHRIIIGKVSGIYGVSGWVRIHSYTRPKENIFSYSTWLIGHGEMWEASELIEGVVKGRDLLANLKAIKDRDVAKTKIGQDIAVYRYQMPELAEGEYYWCDLIQLEVVNLQGESLGKVTEIQETGANDVLVISGNQRHLVPLILDRYVIDIDHENARILVDWDPRYN